jgi:hypothetical protein
MARADLIHGRGCRNRTVPGAVALHGHTFPAAILWLTKVPEAVEKDWIRVSHLGGLKPIGIVDASRKNRQGQPDITPGRQREVASWINSLFFLIGF